MPASAAVRSCVHLHSRRPVRDAVTRRREQSRKPDSLGGLRRNIRLLHNSHAASDRQDNRKDISRFRRDPSAFGSRRFCGSVHKRLSVGRDLGKRLLIRECLWRQLYPDILCDRGLRHRVGLSLHTGYPYLQDNG